MSRICCAYFIMVLLLTGCSTILEVSDENDLGVGYRKEVDHKGHTVYRRERVKVRADNEPEYLLIEEPTRVSLNEDIAPLDELQHSSHISESTNSEMPRQIDHAKNLNTLSPLSTQSGFNSSIPTESTAENNLKLDDSDNSVHASQYKVGFFGAGTDKDNAFHGGITLAFEFTEMLSMAGSLAFFNSDKTYFGFGADIKLALPTKLAPYAGFGIYLGDNKRCEERCDDYTYEVVETCEKYFLSTGYPEVGLQYTFNETTLRLFARDYSQIRQSAHDEFGYFTGIAIEFR